MPALSKVVLTDKQVDELVKPQDLIKKVEEILKKGAKAPMRPSVEERGSWFSTMLAGGLGYYVVKIVGIYPNNPKRGLPLVRGIVLLFDAETGEPLMEVPASSFTGWRTAATTALALKVMGAKGGTLGIVGAGFQGTYHANVLRSAFSFDKYLIYDIDEGRASRLAKDIGGEVVEIEKLLRESDVIVSATTSRRPLIKGSYLKVGSRIASIGAPKPIKEVDIKAIERAGCILADTREGVLNEAGCVEEAIKNNVKFEVVELSEILRGERNCKPKELWLYKSVGTAALDLATAIYLFEVAKDLL